MDAAIRDAIARIDVMQSGRSISRGTGFVVADGLVLTACHVVADRSQEPPALYPGEIVLHFPNHATRAALNENYWDRGSDWALLRCESPPQIRPLPLADRTRSGVEWQTYGFPDANPRDGMVQIGTIENHLGELEGTRVYQLFSRQAAAGNGAPVKGLSGGPVIVGNAVVGLLRFALMKEQQTVAGTLYACPAVSVMERCGPILPRQPTGLSDVNVDQRTLREAMVRALSLEDLESVCADVQQDLADAGIHVEVNLEMVGGSGKTAKILNLVQYLGRRGYLGYLVDAVRRARPELI